MSYDPLGILNNSTQELPVRKKNQADPLGILQIEPKKKEISSPAFSQELDKWKNYFGVGGTVGSSVLPSVKPEFKIDENDPVKSILSKLREDYNKKNEEYNLLRGNELFNSGESTRQINSGNKLYYEQQAQNLSKAKKAANEAGNKYFTPALYLEENAFQNGLQAKQYLQARVAKNGKLNPDNETERLAQRKVEQYEKVANSVIEKGLQNAAIDEAMNDPASGEQLTKQYKELVGMGQDLPPAMKGLFVANFLYKHNKDLQAFAEEHPAFAEEYEHIRDNLYAIYPEFGRTVVANKVSRERQARGLNNKFANFNTQKFNENTDKIAEEILSPQELATYNQEIKDHKKKYIDTGGFLNRAEEAIEGGWHGTTGSLKHLLGGSSRADDLYSELNKEATKVDSGAKGIAAGINEMGSFVGTLGYIGAGGNALKLGGLTPAMASRTMMGLTFYDDFAKQAAAKYPDEPWKAQLSALANTTGLMLASNIFPAKKLNQVFSSVKPEIETAIKDLSVGVTDKQIVKDALANAFKKGLEPYLKGIGEMSALTQFNRSLDKALGLDQSAYNHYHPENEMTDVVKSMAIGGLLPNALIGVGSYRGKSAMKNFIYESASNPMRMNSAIDMQNIPDEVKQKLKANIDFLSKSKADLDSRDVPEDKQKEYLFKSLRERNLNEQIENTVEPTIKKELQQQVKNNNEVKETILKGGDEQKVIQRQSSDLVKEFYDEDLLKKAHKEMLETAPEEGKEPKLDEKKILPFLKYVAQQVNNITEDGKFNTESDARKSAQKSFPEAIIEAANEAFPDYKKIAEENEFTEVNIHPINYTDNGTLQKSSPSGVLQHPQEGFGETGSERGRMEQGEQGEITTETPIGNEINPEEVSQDTGKEEILGDGEKKTGIKNAISRESRITLDLPKVELPKIGSDYQRLSEGKEVVDSGKVNPQEVVDKVLQGKGKIGMHPEEAAAMQYYMHQLGTAQDLIAKQLSLDIEPTEKLELVSQQQQLSDLMDAATEANMLAGTAWSSVGNTRQILVDEAFNPSREKAVIKDAYGGEIPKDVQLKIDTALKERDAAIAEKNKLEEQLKNQAAQQTISGMRAKRSAKTDYKQKRTNLIEELKKAKEEHEQWLKDRGIQKQGAGFTLTGKMIKIIGELAKTYVDQGIEKLSDVIAKVHDDVKGYLTGIDVNDVRDAIAMYHAEKLETKATGLENKIAAGVEADINKIKPKFQRNNQWVKANQRVANAEYKIKNLKREAFNSKKNFYQRGLNWGGKLFRASVLSGYNVLYKLAAAATIGGAGKRIPEQVIGGIWSQVFKGVAQKAPIEGFINAKSEAKFYKDFFNPKKFIHNSWEIIKGNESDLSRQFGNAQYGKAGKIPLPANTPKAVQKGVSVTGKVLERILSLPTDLHQVIKDPVKRATFEASFHNGLVWAEKNGLDINDPLVINALETASYKRANYEIFMEQNWLSRKFGEFKTKMEKSGNLGATGKFIADFMIPVSTVPTNIVRRLVTTSPAGFIRGGIQVTEAYRKGIENLTNEQADAIMRQLKQGSLGTALWLIGWFGASHFGGLYSKYNPNKQREEGDLPSDEMEVNGQMIPKPVQHALPLEIIQWAATARHIYDNYKENKDASTFESIYKAGMGSIGAVAEHIPIIETATHVVGSFENPYEAQKLEEDVKRRFEPQILRETGVIPKKEPQTSSSKPKKPHKQTKHKKTE